MAAGKLEAADALLEKNRPLRYLDDVAVYHFIAGRLAMERGKWDVAEIKLGAARELGLSPPSFYFFWGLLKARRRQWRSSLEALDEVKHHGDKELNAQADALREMIEAVFSGQARKQVDADAARFCRQTLGMALSQYKEADRFETTLFEYLVEQQTGQPLGQRKREGAAAALGAGWVRLRKGCWALGLDARAHTVVVDGIEHHPWQRVIEVLEGRTEVLFAPADGLGQRIEG
jgi:hypothetical protein